MILYWWGKEAKGAGCEGHWRHCILEGFRPQVKAKEVPTLRSLISVLASIEEAANNVQLSKLFNVMF